MVLLCHYEACIVVIWSGDSPLVEKHLDLWIQEVVRVCVCVCVCLGNV